MPFALIHIFFLVICPQIWWQPLMGLRIDILLFPLWFIYLVVLNKFGNAKFGSQEKFFLFFVIWIIISLLLNHHLAEEFGEFVFFYIKWYIMFIFLQMSLENEKSLSKYIIFIVFLSTVLAVEGIDHFLSPDGLGWIDQTLGWSDGEKGRTRWTGIFDGPGVFCVIYTISLPFLLAFTHKNYNFFIRLIALCLICIFIFAVFCNGSRGGILTVVGIFSLHFFYLLRKNIIYFIILGFVFFIGYRSLPEHMTQLSDKHNSSGGRLEVWADGCDMFKARPIIGVGRGRFIKITFTLIAHNSFIEIMAETGMVGLFLYFGIYYFSLRKIYFYIKDGNIDTSDYDHNMLMAKALGLSILGYILSSMFVTLEYETIYMLLALCSVFGRSDIKGIFIDSTTTNDLLLIAGATIFFIVGTNIFVSFIGPALVY